MLLSLSFGFLRMYVQASFDFECGGGRGAGQWRMVNIFLICGIYSKSSSYSYINVIFLFLRHVFGDFSVLWVAFVCFRCVAAVLTWVCHFV